MNCLNLISFSIIIILFLTLPASAAVNGVLCMEMWQAVQEGNLSKQHEIAQKIIEVNPEDPFGYSHEADYLFKMEKYEDAIIYYSKAINAITTVKKSDSLKLKNMGMNEKQINEILNYNSSLAKYYEQRGDSLLRLGKPEEALKDFDKAEECMPGGIYELPLLKALCYIKLERFDEALKNLNAIRKIAITEKDINTIDKIIQFVNSIQDKQER